MQRWREFRDAFLSANPIGNAFVESYYRVSPGNQMLYGPVTRDLTFFREFRVNEELGALTWGKEIDIAPETLYAAATGASLPGWMVKDVP